METGLAWLVLLALPVINPGQQASAQVGSSHVRRVNIPSDGWSLVGDLQTPTSAPPFPAVLMLNQAAGDRTAYSELAGKLAERGVASLRLDLRGHGESTNLGRFVPGQSPRDPMIWDAESDVTAAVAYLGALQEVDGTKLGIVGASYSGEAAAEAGRLHGYSAAYVLLSPGSLSEESIQGIGQSGVPWLFIASRDDQFLREITASVQTEARSAELILLPGASHATDLLDRSPELAERIAAWLSHRLR